MKQLGFRAYSVPEILFMICQLIAAGILVTDILLVVIIKQQRELIQTINRQGSVKIGKNRSEFVDLINLVELLDVSDIDFKTRDQVIERISAMYEEQTGKSYSVDADTLTKIELELSKLGYSQEQVTRDGRQVTIFRAKKGYVY